MKEKRGQFVSNLLPWIILIILVVILFVFYGAVNGWFNNTLDYFKNLVKFGR